MTQGNDPPPYVGPDPGTTGTKKGFPVWLIVVLGFGGFVLVVAGALAALAYTGYTRFLRAAKTAEARAGIGRMAKDAAVAYDREVFNADGTVTHELCASASTPVPADVTRIRGVKYASAAGDWQVDRSANAGFACLRFSMLDPQRYQYDYKATGAGGAPVQFRAIARGDIDGDAALSTFALEGRLMPGDMVTISPTILETDPDE